MSTQACPPLRLSEDRRYLVDVHFPPDSIRPAPPRPASDDWVLVLDAV